MRFRRGGRPSLRVVGLWGDVRLRRSGSVDSWLQLTAWMGTGACAREKFFCSENRVWKDVLFGIGCAHIKRRHIGADGCMSGLHE